MDIAQILIDIADFLGGLFDFISELLYYPVSIDGVETNVLNVIFMVGIPLIVFILIVKALLK